MPNNIIKSFADKSVNDLLESTNIKSIKEKFKDYFKKINIYEYNDKVSIDLIITNEKNQGYGTKLMNEIIDYCDKTNKIIILTPSDEFGGNKKRLIEFYKRFGFLENKGKNKIFDIFESMYRLPKNKQNENYKGLNMEIEKLVEGLGKAKLSFVTKAMIAEKVESLDEAKLNEYLDAFEEYKNSVMESEKFATLVEGKDVDSLTEKEIEDLIEKCSEEIEDELDEAVKLSDVEDLLGKGTAHGKYTKFTLKDGTYVLFHPTIGLEYRAKDDSLLPHNWKTVKAMKKELTMAGMLKEQLEENFIGKAMLELSKGNTGSAIENFKTAMLSTLSKNETYREIDTKMSLYVNEAKPIKVDGKDLDWNKLRSNYKNKHFKYNGTVEDLKDGVTIMFDKNFIIYPDIKNDKYYVINLASESLVDMVQGSRAEKDLKVYIDKYK